MTFPAYSNDAVHVEDGAKFIGVGGKWIRHKPGYKAIAHGASSNDWTQQNFPEEIRRTKTHVKYTLAFKSSANCTMQFVTSLGTNWMDYDVPNSIDYAALAMEVDGTANVIEVKDHAAATGAWMDMQKADYHSRCMGTNGLQRVEMHVMKVARNRCMITWEVICQTDGHNEPTIANGQMVILSHMSNFTGTYFALTNGARMLDYTCIVEAW